MGQEKDHRYFIKGSDGTGKVVTSDGVGGYVWKEIKPQADLHEERVDRSPSGLKIYTSPTSGKTRAYSEVERLAVQGPQTVIPDTIPLAPVIVLGKLTLFTSGGHLRSTTSNTPPRVNALDLNIRPL